MAKKKKSQPPERPANGSPSTVAAAPAATAPGSRAPPPPRLSSTSSLPQLAQPSSTMSPLSSSSAAAAQPPEPSTSALIICRNKHWRYISSFHGPWLQLPVDVLESLANTNYLSPRPVPIDPAVFFDLVKIRKAVDEATNLAVRATSGLTSAALSNSLNAGNGMLGGAAALGLGFGGGGGGGNARLSRERKHRMRELATQKLSQAYHLDEIASSVATMQSASTLEDVAQFVLQRNSTDVDAKYVHFFHEKIPSRMMAQYTPLDTLNDIVTERPMDGSPLRTRALTRIFKDDYQGAAKDLTEALVACRYMLAQHKAGKDQLVLARTVQEQTAHARDWRQETKVPEEDQPNSLEAQLLFHRAGVYFTIACQHVHASLDGFKEVDQRFMAQREEYSEQQKQSNGNSNTTNNPETREGLETPTPSPPPLTADEKETRRKCLEARKMVKSNAKRALRDYIAFLSHFEYTPGLSPDTVAELLKRFCDSGNNNYSKAKASGSRGMIETTKSSMNRDVTNQSVSDALVPHKKQPQQQQHQFDGSSKIAPLDIYQVAALFSSSPPPNLLPYPPASLPCFSQNAASLAAAAMAEFQEAVTYHPLLTDALHSLLLCHALLQTPPKELQRHAYNAARIARVCDGYPVFLAARSPARADWIEVLRRAGNWIGLTQSWESLCRPAPLPSHSTAPSSSSSNASSDITKTGSSSASSSSGRHSSSQQETETQKRERQKHEAILDALADERVVDEESFQRAVRARQRRAREDEEVERAAGHNSVNSASPTSTQSSSSASMSLPQPRRWAQENGREYPISTERAGAISRWVKEAPLTIEGAKTRKGKKGKGASTKDRKIHNEGGAAAAAAEIPNVEGLTVKDIYADRGIVEGGEEID